MKLSRNRARVRRALGRAAAFVPALAVVALDLAYRHASYRAMMRADFAAMAITWALSAAVWTSAVVVSARRRGAARFAAWTILALLGALAALQAAAFEYFAATIDFPMLASAWQLEGMGDLARPFLGTIVRWTATGAAAALAWSALVGRIARTRRLAARRSSLVLGGGLAVAAVGTSYLPHVSTDAAPDVLALGAAGRFVLERPKLSGTASFINIPDVDLDRHAEPVPPAQPTTKRNVLFILTESVRASSYCSAYRPDCPYNPFSNELLRDRLPLERMRSLDSFTLISFGVMFTGLPVTAPKHDWLTAPLLFDYAHAAGISTAYWSAQHPAFANSHDWTDHESLDRLAWATDFDPKADKVLGADDADAVARAIQELPTLREPFFAVVHYSSTHYPYRVDSDAPFRPLGLALDRRGPDGIRNRYLDAIYRQDKSTAELVKAVRAMPLGERTVIVFVSDHGESFYEHDAVFHGSSLWDEEIHVPAWIDAPQGLLSPAELASLRGLRDQPVTQLDLAPTVLDLLGLHEVAAWRSLVARMPGESLLRSPAGGRAASMATCDELWPCFIHVSGKLIGDLKLVQREPEPYRCFDTRADPQERHDLGARACGEP